MNISNLSKADVRKSLVLVIDVQKNLLPAIPSSDGLIAKIETFLGIAGELNIPVIFSEHYPKGLGHTADLLLNAAPRAPVFEKITFSCLENDKIASGLNEYASTGRSHIFLVGLETHACVAQTAMDAVVKNFEVTIVSDAVASRYAINAEVALSRLARFDVDISTVEAVAFEWLRDASHPAFKRVSALVK